MIQLSRRTVAIGWVAVLAISLLVAIPGTAAAAVPPPQPCAYAGQAALNDGWVWVCVDDGDTLSWRRPVDLPRSDFRELRNGHSGMCLEVASASTANNAPVQQWPCITSGHQWWAEAGNRNGYKLLVNYRSRKCLGVGGNASQKLQNGTGLILWDCSMVNDQWWRPEVQSNWTTVYRNLHSGQVIGIAQGSLTAGSRAIQWPRINGVTDQTWAVRLLP
jgi:hypothetical protein